MKSAVHYAMTPEGDEVWIILTPEEYMTVQDCLELAQFGVLRGADGAMPGQLIAVFSRTALRAAARLVAEKVARCGGAKACPHTLRELHNKLRYEADWLRRAADTRNHVRVEEARTGLPAGQEA